ncbi:MAG: SH3 domain-containing protein [Geminicoccaceae bacterium]
MFALALAICLAPAIAMAQTGRSEVGRDSGLALPRYVSLGAERIYMRTGPGKEFPIKWIYTKTGLPMQVIEESDDWREVRDPDGETGWIHKSLLSGKRYLMVRGDIANLRRTPSDEAMVVARIEPEVVVEMLNCQPVWCLVNVDDRRGWLARRDVLGLLANELP